MYNNYIWVSLFLGGITTILYLFILDILVRRVIKKKLFIPQSKLDKPSVKNNYIPFESFTFPVKNKLLIYTPQNMKKKLESIINLSGIKWQLGDILLLKLALAISFILSYFIFAEKLGNIIPKPFILIILSAVGFIIPDFYLKRKARLRRQKIKCTLPHFIDYLIISVEAGLGLDMAITRVLGQIHGPLAEEIANAMVEIKYGKPKKEAFKNLASRVNISEFTAFLTALINGEQLGVSLGTILKVQGQQVREKRKQRIQEQAYKIPVKLVIPLVLFILPGLFIVLLGPAIITVSNTIMK